MSSIKFKSKSNTKLLIGICVLTSCHGIQGTIEFIQKDKKVHVILNIEGLNARKTRSTT